jgi:hypothetical protein
MNLIIFRIIFFLLVPVGIVILVKTIRMLKGIFNGKILAEKLFTDKEIYFEVQKSGVFAVWQKGRLFQRTPADGFALMLFVEPSGEQISMSKSIFRPHLSTMDNARIEMSRFSADAGRYRLQIVEGSSISWLEHLILKFFPSKPVDYSQYYLQVRESKPASYMIAAIPLFILCGFCIITGFVGIFMAPYILSDLNIPFYQ